MEFMLQTVVVMFMLFLCALCLFAVVVIARDIIHENAKNRRERQKEADLEFEKLRREAIENSENQDK